MSTPDLNLETAFLVNGEGRITSTREPAARRGPLFVLARSATRCRWAMRADLAGRVALELERLAREEPPAPNPLTAPVHADRYRSLLAGTGGAETSLVQVDGPAFSSPDATAGSPDVALIEDERRLERHFRGWVPGEIVAGRAPVLAVVEHGEPVSICFCARRSEFAAEAGLETAEAFRGRGFGTRVTSAWAAALRAHRPPRVARGRAQARPGRVRMSLESRRLRRHSASSA